MVKFLFFPSRSGHWWSFGFPLIIWSIFHRFPNMILFLKFWTSTGYFSNSTGSSVTGRFSSFIDVIFESLSIYVFSKTITIWNYIQTYLSMEFSSFIITILWGHEFNSNSTFNIAMCHWIHQYVEVKSDLLFVFTNQVFHMIKQVHGLCRLSYEQGLRLNATSLSWASTTITRGENPCNYIIACRFLLFVSNLTPKLTSKV